MTSRCGKNKIPVRGQNGIYLFYIITEDLLRKNVITVWPGLFGLIQVNECNSPTFWNNLLLQGHVQHVPRRPNNVEMISDQNVETVTSRPKDKQAYYIIITLLS